MPVATSVEKQSIQTIILDLLHCICVHCGPCRFIDGQQVSVTRPDNTEKHPQGGAHIHPDAEVLAMLNLGLLHHVYSHFCPSLLQQVLGEG